MGGLAMLRHYKRLAIALVAVVGGAMVPLAALAQEAVPVAGGAPLTTATGIPAVDSLITTATAFVALAGAWAKWGPKPQPLPPQATLHPDIRSDLATLTERVAGIRRDLDALRADSRDAVIEARAEFRKRLDQLDEGVHRAIRDLLD